MVKSDLESGMVLVVSGVEENPVRMVYFGGDYIFNNRIRIPLRLFNEDFSTPCSVEVKRIDFVDAKKCKCFDDFLSEELAEQVWNFDWNSGYVEKDVEEMLEELRRVLVSVGL